MFEICNSSVQGFGSILYKLLPPTNLETFSPSWERSCVYILLQSLSVIWRYYSNVNVVLLLLGSTGFICYIESGMG